MSGYRGTVDLPSPPRKCRSSGFLERVLGADRSSCAAPACLGCPRSVPTGRFHVLSSAFAGRLPPSGPSPPGASFLFDDGSSNRPAVPLGALPRESCRFCGEPHRLGPTVGQSAQVSRSSRLHTSWEAGSLGCRSRWPVTSGRRKGASEGHGPGRSLDRALLFGQRPNEPELLRRRTLQVGKTTGAEAPEVGPSFRIGAVGRVSVGPPRRRRGRGPFHRQSGRRTRDVRGLRSVRTRGASISDRPFHPSSSGRAFELADRRGCRAPLSDSSLSGCAQAGRPVRGAQTSPGALRGGRSSFGRSPVQSTFLSTPFGADPPAVLLGGAVGRRTASVRVDLGARLVDRRERGCTMCASEVGARDAETPACPGTSRVRRPLPFQVQVGHSRWASPGDRSTRVAAAGGCRVWARGFSFPFRSVGPGGPSGGTRRERHRPA